MHGDSRLDFGREIPSVEKCDSITCMHACMLACMLASILTNTKYTHVQTCTPIASNAEELATKWKDEKQSYTQEDWQACWRSDE
jgi:hypothetical protein